MADYKRFSNSCKPYTGAALPFMIAACDAPDGSHWALQQWQRLWRELRRRQGRRTSSTSRTGAATSATSRSRPTTATTASTSTCGARSRSTASRSSALKWTLQGVPLDKQGRNVYVDYLTGPTWHRVNSFLTHPPTAGFCYTFANHPAARRRPGTARARATPTAPRPSARASRRSCRCTSRRPARTRRASDDAANAAQAASCSAATRAAASTERRAGLPPDGERYRARGDWPRLPLRAVGRFVVAGVRPPVVAATGMCISPARPAPVVPTTSVVMSLRTRRARTSWLATATPLGVSWLAGFR